MSNTLPVQTPSWIATPDCRRAFLTSRGSRPGSALSRIATVAETNGAAIEVPLEVPNSVRRGRRRRLLRERPVHASDRLENSARVSAVLAQRRHRHGVTVGGREWNGGQAVVAGGGHHDDALVGGPLEKQVDRRRAFLVDQRKVDDIDATLDRIGEGQRQIVRRAAAVVVEYAVGKDRSSGRCDGDDRGDKGTVTGGLVDVAVAVVIDPVSLLPRLKIAVHQIEPARDHTTAKHRMQRVHPGVDHCDDDAPAIGELVRFGHSNLLCPAG